MNNTNLPDLPPLPKPGASGPQVCAVVRLYLAVLDNLPAEQVHVLLSHVDSCPDCAKEYRLLNSATQMISNFAGLTNSQPSARVDSAVMAAIATRRDGGPGGRPPVPESAPISAPISARLKSSLRSRDRGYPAGVLLRRIGQVFAAAAVVLLMLFATVRILGNFGTSQAFVLPADLTWSGYVLYHSESKMSKSGERYHVDTYHNLGTDGMHVETTLDGRLDVVAIKDANQVLGMDMMHHVAQWGADAWCIDDSQFDLAKLRSDLQAKRAVYLGKGQFNGQTVYRIRSSDGNILLLDTGYRPVNMLHGEAGPDSNKPIYDNFKLLRLSEVPSDMWEMSIPAGFKMGTLPERP